MRAEKVDDEQERTSGWEESSSAEQPSTKQNSKKKKLTSTTKLSLAMAPLGPEKKAKASAHSSSECGPLCGSSGENERKAAAARTADGEAEGGPSENEQ